MAKLLDAQERTLGAATKPVDPHGRSNEQPIGTDLDSELEGPDTALDYSGMESLARTELPMGVN